MISHVLKLGMGFSDFCIPEIMTFIQLWLPNLTSMEELCLPWELQLQLKHSGKVTMSKCEGRLVFLPRLGQSSKLI